MKRRKRRNQHQTRFIASSRGAFAPLSFFLHVPFMAHGAFQPKSEVLTQRNAPFPMQPRIAHANAGGLHAERHGHYPAPHPFGASSPPFSYRGGRTQQSRLALGEPGGFVCSFCYPAAGLPAWINQYVGVCVACCVYTLARGQNSPWGTCAIPLNDASVCLTKCRRGRLKRVRPARLSPCPPAPSPGLRWNSGSMTALPPHPAGSWSAPSSGSPAEPASW